jgi:hypothetical protein
MAERRIVIVDRAPNHHRTVAERTPMQRTVPEQQHLQWQTSRGAGEVS